MLNGVRLRCDPQKGGDFLSRFWGFTEEKQRMHAFDLAFFLGFKVEG